MVPMAVHLQASLGQVIFTEASLWSTFATHLAALMALVSNNRPKIPQSCQGLRNVWNNLHHHHHHHRHQNHHSNNIIIKGLRPLPPTPGHIFCGA